MCPKGGQLQSGTKHCRVKLDSSPSLNPFLELSEKDPYPLDEKVALTLHFGCGYDIPGGHARNIDQVNRAVSLPREERKRHQVEAQNRAVYGQEGKVGD